MIKTVLIDDHELVRSGIESLFATDDRIQLTASLASLDDAYSSLADCDVLVVDAMLGDKDAMVQLLGDEPWIEASKIVVVTGQTNPQYLLGIDQTGVAAIVSKASDPNNLLEAVLSASNGMHYRCEETTKILALSDKTTRPFLTLLADLSQRERQITERSAAGQRPVDIAADLQLSIKTVTTYRYRAYQKLGCKNDVELSRMFIEAGVGIDGF